MRIPHPPPERENNELDDEDEMDEEEERALYEEVKREENKLLRLLQIPGLMEVIAAVQRDPEFQQQIEKLFR